MIIVTAMGKLMVIVMMLIVVMRIVVLMAIDGDDTKA